MTPTPKRTRVSASSIKLLLHCSMAYWYARVLKLPEKVWPRTVIGSLCHSLFECLRHARHRHHYDAITAPKTSVDYTLSPAVARLVRAWKVKHGIADDLLADLNAMLYVGLILVDYHWEKADRDETGAPKAYGPEHEFDLVLRDGTEIKGFIDDMAEQDSVMVVRDYKSQRYRFDADELSNSIQAAVYQLYVWSRFGKLARVEFVLLRHPPTKRTPDKHLQVVPPASPMHLGGLTDYIQSVSARVNQFGLEDAWSSPCQDVGWCRNVCSFYKPMSYWSLVKRGDPAQTPIKGYPIDTPPTEVAPDEMLVRKEHPGCLAAWRG